MLQIHVEKQELFNPKDNRFIYTDPVTVNLEHSLISLTKWEAIFEKSFLSSLAGTHGLSMTREEVRTYLQCMVIGKAPTRATLSALMHKKYVTLISNYINSPQSATTINTIGNQKGRGSIITSEIIYYWMTAFGIPFECEKWHLNRLLMLVQVCEVKSNPDKLSGAQSALYRQKLNQARRKGG